MMLVLVILNLDKVQQHFLVEKLKELNLQVNSKRSQQEKLFIFLMNQQLDYTVMMFKLIDVLQRIVDQGDTIIVIEHNLDVIKLQIILLI